MTPDQAVEDVLPLSGRGLRFVLVDQLRQHHTMTVTQMVAVLTEHGYVLAGRPSKVISDALRWETARGRVVRVGRGVYRCGRTPPSTARRIKTFAAACREWIVAMRRGQELPRTPPNKRTEPWWPPEDPLRPPWQTLYWLWTT